MTLHSAPPSVSHSVSSLMSLSGNTWRENFLVHDDYWMAVAALAAKRSKDPRTQVDYTILLNINLISHVNLSAVIMFDLLKGHPKSSINPTSN